MIRAQDAQVGDLVSVLWQPRCARFFEPCLQDVAPGYSVLALRNAL